MLVDDKTKMSLPKYGPILAKFEKLRHRQKTLYVKAFEFMRATTQVLAPASAGEESISATAYFVPIVQMIE